MRKKASFSGRVMLSTRTTLSGEQRHEPVYQKAREEHHRCVERLGPSPLSRDDAVAFVCGGADGLAAGKVGTQLLGYNNRLLSENLEQLPDDEEPGWMSDEWFVWDGGYSVSEIRSAESEARLILERERVRLIDLAEALLVKGELNKDEIRRIITRR
jgi:hypothetical protein